MYRTSHNWLENEEQPIAEPIKKHFYLISTYRRESVKVHRVTLFFPIISRPSKEISRQLVAGLEELPPLLDESSTIDQYGARRHRFQRENNEICSIIGRQFIVAEWFLLRLTTAGTEGATKHSKEDNLPWGDGPFFHPPLSLASASASASAFWSSSRSTANPEDLFPIGGPIVSFFFTSLLSRTATRFLLLVPAPPPFLASDSRFDHPPPFSLFLSSSSYLRYRGRCSSSASSDLARLSAASPPSRDTGSFYLTCGADTDRQSGESCSGGKQA